MSESIVLQKRYVVYFYNIKRISRLKNQQQYRQCILSILSIVFVVNVLCHYAGIVDDHNNQVFHDGYVFPQLFMYRFLIKSDCRRRAICNESARNQLLYFLLIEFLILRLLSALQFNLNTNKVIKITMDWWWKSTFTFTRLTIVKARSKRVRFIS